MSFGTVSLTSTDFKAGKRAQSLDLNGTGTGGVLQVLQTVPGTTYVLRYLLAGNPNCGGSVKPLVVLAGAAQIDARSFDTTGHTSADPGWTTASARFTASAMTVLPSLIASTFRKARPYLPTGVRQAPAITTSVRVGPTDGYEGVGRY